MGETSACASPSVRSHAQTKDGAFSANGTPSAAIHLWGNVVRALLDLGVGADERLDRAVDRLARSVTGDGYASYFKSGLQGPEFVCAANYGPCGWGVAPCGRAGAVPAEDARRQSSGASGPASILLSYDIARRLSYQERVNSSWFKFGYPLGYVTDVLLNLEALTGPVWWTTRDWTAPSRWCCQAGRPGALEAQYGYHGKMWIDVEQKGQPSKWVCCGRCAS